MYFNCHNHTMYSNLRLLDCINEPKALIDKAIELGLTGIAITDHECLSAHMEVNQYAKKLLDKHPDFTIALGNEIYLTDNRDSGQKYYHFILIAKDELGHKALRELSTIAWYNSYIDRRMERVPVTIEYDGPIALRYPRGNAYDGFPEHRAPVEYGKSEVISEGKEIAILSVGHMFEEAVKVSANLKDLVFDHSLVNARFIKPIDEAMIDELAKEHKLIVTIEENVQTGGYGEKVLEYVARKGLDVKVLILALPDQYIEHGNISVLRQETGIDSQTMTERIIKAYKEL